ncbi:NBR1-Ig-like domain-containing protein [Hyalangium gracile]|uniref:NBR1-Ig-like domain-containing protein n=1 Tax=Hyalangium gracile TaxID=394092 RepID=UPI001CCFC2F1|nr:NBR1-Ig-like domain-containing protein [Hyalangium gracile]
MPSTVQKGTYFTAVVTMKNTGGSTWTDTAGYRLGSQNPQDNTTWGRGRVYLDSADATGPGATKTFIATFKAPTTTGNYVFQWKMVQDGVSWFGASTPVTRILVVNSPCYCPPGQTCPDSCTDPNL